MHFAYIFLTSLPLIFSFTLPQSIAKNDSNLQAFNSPFQEHIPEAISKLAKPSLKFTSKDQQNSTKLQPVSSQSNQADSLTKIPSDLKQAEMKVQDSSTNIEKNNQNL
ncbi:hypothetical protein K502DRAFT_145302 [Neoconidiobolus thromboides FSU 785]|nr:hypothetical protein K502DRAFT_145302 [Neoconidiobolus thromboides FSU 785]